MTRRCTHLLLNALCLLALCLGMSMSSAMAAGVVESVGVGVQPLLSSTGAGGMADTPSSVATEGQADEQADEKAEDKATERESAGSDGGLESPEQGPACGLLALPELDGHPAAMPPVCQAARPWLQGLRRPPRLS